nr:AzoD [Aspergillus insulicola]
MSPLESCQLSPIDELFPPIYLRCQLFFPETNPANCIANLQLGVKRLLAAVPLLTGKIERSRSLGWTWKISISSATTFDITRVFKIKYHDMALGQMFKGATTEANPGLPFESCMPLPLFFNTARPAPIFGLQANVHSDGLLLSLAVSHMVFDATGMGTVISSLAKCCRARDDAISLPSSTSFEAETRRKLESAIPASSTTFADHFGDYTAAANIPAAELCEDVSYVAAGGAYNFTLAAHKVERLKTLCNTWIERTAPEGIPWVSSNDIVVALLWLCVNRARFPQLRDNSVCSNTPTTLWMPVNIRGRLRPAIPESYMGNAAISLQCTHQNLDHFTSPEENLTGESDKLVMLLCRLSQEIRAGIHSMDDEYVRALLFFIINNPATLPPMGVTDVCVSSWRNIDIYGAEFGEGIGRPLRMRYVDAVGDGVIFIMPQRQDKASPWEINVSLKDETMKVLSTDPLWVAYMDVDDFWS